MHVWSERLQDAIVGLWKTISTSSVNTRASCPTVYCPPQDFKCHLLDLILPPQWHSTGQNHRQKRNLEVNRRDLPVLHNDASVYDGQVHWPQPWAAQNQASNRVHSRSRHSCRIFCFRFLHLLAAFLWILCRSIAATYTRRSILTWVKMHGLPVTENICWKVKKAAVRACTLLGAQGEDIAVI